MPDGYYNLERMLKRFATGHHKVLLCGTCMDARGLTEVDLVDSATRSSMDELAKAPWRLTRCSCSKSAKMKWGPSVRSPTRPLRK